MTMTLTQADWDAARALCAVLSEEFDPAEHQASSTKCNWCCHCASALAQTRAGEADRWRAAFGVDSSVTDWTPEVAAKMLDEALAAADDAKHAREEGEWRAIGVLHDALSGAFAAIDPEEDPELSERLARLLDCDGPGPCREYQREMDAAREEGRREERREICDFLSHRCNFAPECGTCIYCAIRLWIAARGPMEESHE